MYPLPSHSDLYADANYKALIPRPRLSPSFQCPPDWVSGSIAVCPTARVMRAWRLLGGSLVSLRRIVRRIPDGCPTAHSYCFGVSFDTCPSAARRRARSMCVRQLDDGSFVHFHVSFDAYSAAAPQLARITSVYHSMRAQWLPDGLLLSLRRIARCVPNGCPTACSYRLIVSFDRYAVIARRLALLTSADHSTCAR
jgi:hypothetical protein